MVLFFFFFFPLPYVAAIAIMHKKSSCNCTLLLSKYKEHNIFSFFLGSNRKGRARGGRRGDLCR
jgi:hypothetical protein